MTSPELSVVVPVFNERDNITPLVDEIVAALRGLVAFEILCVDDHSSDDTLAMLQALKAGVPELRVLHHVSQSGQSTAVRNGIKAARGTWIATLDGDGQNDPADIPKLLAARDAAAPRWRNADMDELHWLDQPIHWLYWTGLHVTGWKLIGYTGALMFGARWLVQFIATRRAGKPVIPRLFWYMSVVGSLMTLSYFLFSAKQDSEGVLQNLFPSFVALYNLVLDIRHRGWHRDRASH